MRRQEMTWSWLGTVPYREAVRAMDKVADEVAGGASGKVFMLEHTPTISLGRRAGLDALKIPAKALAEMGISVERTERGGLATYHGPGQLVCYPVVDLKKLGLGVGGYVEALLKAAAKALDAWGVKDCRVDIDKPGVWTSKGKIAAVGLRVSGSVATHGIAINLKVEKKRFEAIIPCGIEGAATADVSDFAKPPAIEAAAIAFAATLGDALGAPTTRLDGDDVKPRGEQVAA